MPPEKATSTTAIKTLVPKTTSKSATTNEIKNMKSANQAGKSTTISTKLSVVEASVEIATKSQNKRKLLGDKNELEAPTKKLKKGGDDKKADSTSGEKGSSMINASAKGKSRAAGSVAASSSRSVKGKGKRKVESEEENKKPKRKITTADKADKSVS